MMVPHRGTWPFCYTCFFFPHSPRRSRPLAGYVYRLWGTKSSQPPVTFYNLVAVSACVNHHHALTSHLVCPDPSKWASCAIHSHPTSPVTIVLSCDQRICAKEGTNSRFLWTTRKTSVWKHPRHQVQCRGKGCCPQRYAYSY